MGIMFDVDAIMEDQTLNTLTREVIEARGGQTGDLMHLWTMALQLGETCARCHFLSIEWLSPIDDEVFPSDVEIDVAETYALMSKLLAREAREIVKFLKLRNFEFPEGSTGKRPPDAIGF